MNTRKELKNILKKSNSIFFLDKQEANACIQGRTNRDTIINNKLEPVIDEIIDLIKEADDIWI